MTSKNKDLNKICSHIMNHIALVGMLLLECQEYIIIDPCMVED